MQKYLQTLTLLSLVHVSNCVQDERYSVTVRMPNVVSEKADSLVCTSMKLDPKETYIVKFIPHASKATAHHMMVYGCYAPASSNASWLCDQEDTGVDSERGVCKQSSRQVMFAWALDASDKALPEGVGLRVSGNTGIKHLIIQMHFKNAFPPGITDNSGVTFELTHSRPPQQAGYLVLGNWGWVPRDKTAFYMDSSCVYRRNYTIYPIGYRTHSHTLGVETSGYRIRSGKWMEIGRMSPQLPQTFYPVSNPGMDIKADDILASRCVMNSKARDDITLVGPTNHDEMCNFYIMYSTYEQGNLHTDFCFKNAQEYTWQDEFAVKDIPANAGSLEGIKGAEQVKAKFKWT